MPTPPQYPAADGLDAASPVGPDSHSYSSLRSGLLSAVVHLAIAIVLGLLTLDTTNKGGFELQLTTDADLSNEDLTHVELQSLASALPAELEVEIETPQPVTPELLSELPDLTVTDLDLTTSLDPWGTSLAPDVGGGDESLHSSKGRTSVFGLAGEGSKFVYVFDRSTSMTSVLQVVEDYRVINEITPLGAAKQELLRSFEHLTKSDRFQIVFYNESPLLFGKRSEPKWLMPASPERKDEARGFIYQMTGAGGTNHVKALERAIDLSPDVIFLITDGEAKDDPSLRRARTLVRACQDKNIVLNVVLFGVEARPDSSLMFMADESGGQHRFINLGDLAKLN